MIPIYEPYIDKYKKSTIEENWISNYGIYVNIA